MNKRILFLLVASIVLGAGVFGYVKHQKSVEVDTSIAAIIVANSAMADLESPNPSKTALTCYSTYIHWLHLWTFVDCSSCSQVKGAFKSDKCRCIRKDDD